VLCNSCKSVDTLLDRDSSTRIMFLRCQQCSASRTVSGARRAAAARCPRAGAVWPAACSLQLRLLCKPRLTIPSPPPRLAAIKTGFQARTVSRKSQQTG
jgi:hypothetical protein